jgi:hypothetical protein
LTVSGILVGISVYKGVDLVSIFSGYFIIVSGADTSTIGFVFKVSIFSGNFFISGANFSTIGFVFKVSLFSGNFFISLVLEVFETFLLFIEPSDLCYFYEISFFISGLGTTRVSVSASSLII